MWNSLSEDGRREWENDGRIDLRSVTNAVKQLPYHIARQRGHRCSSYFCCREMVSRELSSSSIVLTARPALRNVDIRTADRLYCRPCFVSTQPCSRQGVSTMASQAHPAHPEPDGARRCGPGGLPRKRVWIRAATAEHIGRVRTPLGPIGMAAGRAGAFPVGVNTLETWNVFELRSEFLAWSLMKTILCGTSRWLCLLCGTKSFCLRCRRIRSSGCCRNRAERRLSSARSAGGNQHVRVTAGMATKTGCCLGSCRWAGATADGRGPGPRRPARFSWPCLAVPAPSAPHHQPAA